MLSDLLTSLFNYVSNIMLFITMKLATWWNYFYCLLIGIELGKQISFYGRTIFKRRRRSRIVIGSGCRFRSKEKSNLIGINHRCIIATHASGAQIEIGDGCGFSGTVIGAFDKIILEKNVRCGANTLITDSDWHLDDPRVGKPKPIYIKENVWLGYGVIVMKGVTIGENTIIGSGSVVTKDIPANVIAAGNPCKVIKQLQPATDLIK